MKTKRKNAFIHRDVFIAAVQILAQEPVIAKNDNVVHLGIGFGGTLFGSRFSGFSGYDRLPTISLSYERCIIDNLFNEQSALGVGGLVGFNYASYLSWTSTDLMIGVRAALYYAFVDNLDTYAGAITGYNIHVFAGARYYFAGPLAAFADLGYGYTFANAGIALKF